MNIAEMYIVTPQDDPLDFPLDWRHQVAKAWLNYGKGRLPSAVSNDPFIPLWVSYLRTPTKKEKEACSLVHFWQRHDGIYPLLQAYLLTEMPFASIAGLLSTTEQNIQLYERIFFAVRDDSGEVLPGPTLRAVLPPCNKTEESGQSIQLLRTAAVTGGTDMLNKVLGHNPPDDPQQMLAWLTECELTRRLLQPGQLSIADLTRLHSAQTARMKVDAETKGNEDKPNGDYEMTMSILQMLAPKMIDAAPTEERKKEIEDALKVKMSQHIPEMGLSPLSAEAEQAKMEEVMKQFRSPASG